MMKNIFNDIPESLPEELFEIIAENRNIKIERIISEGHTTPPGEWYDQELNEFVILLSGMAIIRFENDEIVEMNSGDYLIIQAHKRHRVEFTSSDQKCIWLAVHYK